MNLLIQSYLAPLRVSECSRPNPAGQFSPAKDNYAAVRAIHGTL
jgi:hypothetical protein